MYRGAIANEKNDPQFTRPQDPSITGSSETPSLKANQQTNEKDTQQGVAIAIRADQIKPARKRQESLNSFRKEWALLLDRFAVENAQLQKARARGPARSTSIGRQHASPLGVCETKMAYLTA
jgi:hypothetical protein